MIVTQLAEFSRQTPEHKGLKKALAFLNSVHADDLPDGRVEIDGTRVYALIQSYHGKPDITHPRFEAHQRYLDVQYIVSGKEYFGWAPLALLKDATAYNPEKDVMHGIVQTEDFTLTRLQEGILAIVYPADAHAPGLADGEPSPVKKIVVKVLLEDQ